MDNGNVNVPSLLGTKNYLLLIIKVMYSVYLIAIISSGGIDKQNDN